MFNALKSFKLEFKPQAESLESYCLDYLSQHENPKKYRDCVVYLYKILLLKKLNLNSFCTRFLNLKKIEQYAKDNNFDGCGKILSLFKKLSESFRRIILLYFISLKHGDMFYYNNCPIGSLKEQNFLFQKIQSVLIFFFFFFLFFFLFCFFDFFDYIFV